MPITIHIVLLLGLLAAHGTSASAQEWQLVSTGAVDPSFQAVGVNPTQPGRIICATTHALYESVDRGKSWHAAFQSPAGVSIRAIALDPAGPAVLAATDRGLYGAFDDERRWRRVLKGVGDAAPQCTHVAFHPSRSGTVFLGTRGGLFVSFDHGQRWSEVSVPFAARAIVHFAFDPKEPDRLYLVTASGLFVGSINEGRWEQRLGAVSTGDEGENLADSSASAETDDANVTPAHLTAVAVDPGEPLTLYLAGSRGVQRSLDGGMSWQPLPRAGLGSAALIRLVLQRHSPLAMYAATSRGVLQYDAAQERWLTITQGLATTQINDLAAVRGALWAATDQGLYRFETVLDTLSEGPPPTPQELLANFVHEPTIAQVRDASIRYAEVYPEKIASWRTQARLKALVPKFNFTADTNLTDFRHWDSGTNPDSLLRGEKDVDWSANVSWEIGDLIWSDDQTSIDVRSKLMVELRDDIVDEVTRTYFERRRLQVLLLTDPPADQQKLLEKELRLQELTALLDGLTGGYFSRHAGVTQTK